MRLLSDSEQWTIANALRVAADQYANHAADSRCAPRMVAQFLRQHQACVLLADAFENADAVTINE